MTAAGTRSWRTARERPPVQADSGAADDSGTSSRLLWPWAVLAALLGALGGAAVALLVRRHVSTDAPGAQEPHELRAVVDRPAPGPPHP